MSEQNMPDIGPMRKFTIKLKDKLFAHNPEFLVMDDKITYQRSNSVTEEDSVLYTDLNITEALSDNVKHNILMLVEAPEFHQKIYEEAYQNLDKFDLVLTFSKKLLDTKNPNVKFNAYGTTWVHESLRKIYNKKLLCSFVVSPKTITSGHKLRQWFAEQTPANIAIYGKNYKDIPYSKEKNPQSLTNGKIVTLCSYMFSLVIESCREDYYFSEKLIDCFLTGTIPVYWGCPSIGDFFDTKGMLIFETKEEGLELLSKLTPEIYKDMLPHVRGNFERAKKYADFKINSEHILPLIDSD